MDQILLSSRGLEIDSVLLIMQSMSTMHLYLALYWNIVCKFSFYGTTVSPGLQFLPALLKTHESEDKDSAKWKQNTNTYLCTNVCSFSLRISLSYPCGTQTV